MDVVIRKLKIVLVCSIVVSVIWYLNCDTFDHEHQFIDVSTSLPQKSSLDLLEKQILSLNITEKTDPVNAHLFYSDTIKWISDYKISKNKFCLKYTHARTIIFVLSRVTDSKRRNVIRQTWAKNLYLFGSSIKLLFLLGSANDSLVDGQVLREDMQYEDILQFPFVDSYHNCLLKALGLLRWAHYHCSSVKFLIKVDDDMMVNAVNLARFVRNNSNARLSIFGKLHRSSPIRWRTHKWYVSPSEYPKTVYPDFIQASYLMTSDCVPVLYSECLKTLPALWVEDVYITGIVANKTTISLVNATEWHLSDSVQLSDQLFERSVCIGHRLTRAKITHFWNKYRSIGPNFILH